MNPIIEEIIALQGFELVRAQLKAILKIELSNQFKIQGEENDIEVFEERSVPIDKSEDIVVCVNLDNINYSKRIQGSSQGDVTFNIDVFANSMNTREASGYLSSSKKAQRVLGMCRYILDSTKYNNLRLEAGKIGGTEVNSINMYEVPGNKDAASIKMGRLNFQVRISERQELWQGVKLLEYETEIKLYDTEKGFKIKSES